MKLLSMPQTLYIAPDSLSGSRPERAVSNVVRGVARTVVAPGLSLRERTRAPSKSRLLLKNVRFFGKRCPLASSLSRAVARTRPPAGVMEHATTADR